jgi:dsRNA-specific ribonuclease
VIDANFPIYQQAFVHKSISSSNYELLEAYGDKFLKGQFIWILVNTPGIIKADQVDKISNYFQDRDRLRILCQQNGLSQYIVVQSGVNLGDKIESDVFEAFIGAIGLSWDNTLNKGDWAMHKFVTAMYQQFDIDPVNYLEKHTTPKNLVYSLVQQLQLDRDLVSNIVTAKKNEAINYPILSKDINGMVVAIVSYGNQVIGVGETSTKDKYPDVYNKEALNEAYRNVLQSRSLYNLIE